MIRQPAPVVTAALVAIACLGGIYMSPENTSAAAPITGILYQAPAQSPVAGSVARTAGLPEIKISVDPAARALLPAGSDFLAHVVAVSSITLSLRGGPARRSYAQRRKVPSAQPALVQAQTEAARPVVAPAPAVESPQPGRSETVIFSRYDEALQQDSTTKAVNLRVKQGAITFRITHIGRVDGQGVIRYALANEESSDFFLSIINIFRDRNPIPAESLGSYVCAAGREIYGIAHFALGDAKGRPVNIELVESGGERRRFALALDFIF